MRKVLVRLVVFGMVCAMIVPSYTIFANDSINSVATSISIDAKDTTVSKDDSSFDLLKDVSAMDTDGNAYDVTILDDGDFDIATVGEYPITYSVIDPTTEETITEERIVTVIEEKEVPTEEQEVEAEEFVPIMPLASATVNTVADLQTALASAMEGDVFTLSPSFVSGPMTITMPNVNITIDGNGNTWSNGGIVVNGTGTGSVTFTNMKMDGTGVSTRLFQLGHTTGQVILDTVEIRNASATGLYIHSGSAAKTVVKNSIIADNIGGPAVYLDSTANVDMEYTTVENNEGNIPGYESAAISSKNYIGTLNINNTVFRNNKNSATGTIYGGGGGAIEIHYFGGPGVINISESYFVGNETSGSDTAATATCDGGAIYVFDGKNGAVFNIDKTTFDSNIAHDDGGAIMFQSTADPGLTTSITNSTFYGNVAQGLNGGDVSGGAIQYFWNNTVSMTNTISGTTFVNNTAGCILTTDSQSGGAISTSGGGGGLAGLMAAITAAGAVNFYTNSLFVDNHVYNGGVIDPTNEYKDIGNNSTVQTDANFMNVDKSDATAIPNTLGLYPTGLSTNFSTIKAGKEGLIVPTVPIKPEGLAENKSAAEVAGTDERTFNRYKDIGAVESTFVKYDANGGTFGLTPLTSYDGSKYYEPNADSTITKYYDMGYIGLNGTVKAGTALSIARPTYTFLGWSTNPTATTADPIYAPGSSVTHVKENLTLYAVWAISDYDITYVYDGGVAPTTANPTGYGITDTFPIAISNVPTKDGYEFTGWTVDYDNEDIDDITTATKTYSVPAGTTGDIELTAHWTLINYNITYDYDGGVAPTTANPTGYDVEDTFPIAISNIPTKDGYEFTGWTVDYDSEDISDISTATKTYSIPDGTTGDIELTANWSLINYNITYDYDGGAPTTANPTGYDVEDSFPIAISNVPTKEGYEFTGWTVDYDNEDIADITTATKTYSVPDGTTGDIELTAHWTLIYDITYNYNGGTAPTTPNRDSYDAEDDFPLAIGDEPTRDGYTFVGWTVDYDNEDISDITTATKTYSIPDGATGDIELTANWATISYNITYDYDGGAPTTANPTGYDVEDTFPIAISNIPTKEGYEFTGWTVDYDNEDIADITTATKTYSVPAGTTGDIELTAHWTLIYDIIYNYNGGTAPTTPNRDHYDAEDDFPLAIGDEPTRDGYTFVGWTVDYDNEDISDITTATKTYSIPDGATGDIELTANWATISYNITYDYDGGAPTTANPTGYDVEDTFPIAISNIPTKEGYEFTGWTVDYDNEDIADITTATKTYSVPDGTTGDIELTAHWALIYNIIYDYNGGVAPTTGNRDHYDAEDDFPIAIGDEPTRDGYTFVGWTVDYTNEDLTDITIPTKNYSIPDGTTGDITLTAIWEPIPVPVIPDDVTPVSPDIPTGDTTNIINTVSLLSISGLLMILISIRKKFLSK